MSETAGHSSTGQAEVILGVHLATFFSFPPKTPWIASRVLGTSCRLSPSRDGCRLLTELFLVETSFAPTLYFGCAFPQGVLWLYLDCGHISLCVLVLEVSARMLGLSDLLKGVEEEEGPLAYLDRQVRAEGVSFGSLLYRAVALTTQQAESLPYHRTLLCKGLGQLIREAQGGIRSAPVAAPEPGLVERTQALLQTQHGVDLGRLGQQVSSLQLPEPEPTQVEAEDPPVDLDAFFEEDHQRMVLGLFVDIQDQGIVAHDCLALEHLSRSWDTSKLQILRALEWHGCQAVELSDPALRELGWPDQAAGWSTGSFASALRPPPGSAVPGTGAFTTPPSVDNRPGGPAPLFGSSVLLGAQGDRMRRFQQVVVQLKKVSGGSTAGSVPVMAEFREAAQVPRGPGRPPDLWSLLSRMVGEYFEFGTGGKARLVSQASRYHRHYAGSYGVPVLGTDLARVVGRADVAPRQPAHWMFTPLCPEYPNYTVMYQRVLARFAAGVRRELELRTQDQLGFASPSRSLGAGTGRELTIQRVRSVVVQMEQNPDWQARVRSWAQDPSDPWRQWDRDPQGALLWPQLYYLLRCGCIESARIWLGGSGVRASLSQHPTLFGAIETYLGEHSLQAHSSSALNWVHRFQAQILYYAYDLDDTVLDWGLPTGGRSSGEPAPAPPFSRVGPLGKPDQEQLDELRALCARSRDPFEQAVIHIVTRETIAPERILALTPVIVTPPKTIHGSALQPAARPVTRLESGSGPFRPMRRAAKPGRVFLTGAGRAADPVPYATVLFATLQFERALEHLARYPGHLVETLHLAIALNWYGLLRLPPPAALPTSSGLAYLTVVPLLGIWKPANDIPFVFGAREYLLRTIRERFTQLARHLLYSGTERPENRNPSHDPLARGGPAMLTPALGMGTAGPAGAAGRGGGGRRRDATPHIPLSPAPFLSPDGTLWPHKQLAPGIHGANLNYAMMSAQASVPCFNLIRLIQTRLRAAQLGRKLRVCLAYLFQIGHPPDRNRLVLRYALAEDHLGPVLCGTVPPYSVYKAPTTAPDPAQAATKVATKASKPKFPKMGLAYELFKSDDDLESWIAVVRAAREQSLANERFLDAARLAYRVSDWYAAIQDLIVALGRFP